MALTRRKKVIFGILLFLVVLMGGITVTGYWLVRKSLPKTEGELTIEGITSPVKIYRDEYGVPHIAAEHEKDLMFATGYVQAQDRLWQMDFLRRVSAGKLSEIFGAKTIAMDKALRTIGFMRISEMIADSLDDGTRGLAQAYAEGVNYFIQTHGHNLPVEFVLLNFEPEPWKIEHSIALSRLLAWQLSFGWYTDVCYDKILDSVGYQKMQEILPRWPDDAPVIVRKSSSEFVKVKPKSKTISESTYRESDFAVKKHSSALDEFAEVNFEIKKLLGMDGFSIGSNNWVVSGKRSTTGKPLLANDPHLAHSAPPTWYEMHLIGGRFNVTGFMLPGMPFVVLGNNRNIAWGFTNVMSDDVDFYKESVRGNEYLLDGRWERLTYKQEEIRVKDSSAVILQIPFTHRGPIVNTAFDLIRDQKEAISVRWLGGDRSNEIRGILELNLAKNWLEFRDATKWFKVPGQNVVYADAEGNIGYQCMSGIPLRKNGNGLTVLDGTKRQNDWAGTVPFEELPFAYNPDEGFIASANNKTAGDWFPYFISNYWENPSRITRIYDFLKSKEKFSPDDFKDLQNDVFSFHAKDVMPYILEACAGDPIFSNENKDSGFQYHEAYLFLKHWDFRMDRGSQATALFNVFFQRLLWNTFHDDLGDPLYESFVRLIGVSTRVTSQLLKNNKSVWWDNVRTGRREDRDEIIKMSLKEAVESLSARLGKESGGWKWEKLHTVTFEHVIGKQKPMDYLFNIGPFPIGGNTTTLNNSEYRSSDTTFRCLVGASMRRIVDLGDLSHPQTVLTLGQSGQPYSQHYSDQVQDWLNGRYKKVSMNLKEIEKESQLLLLKPKD